MSFINDIINLIVGYYPLLLEGIFNTLFLATVGTIFGIIIGLIIAIINNIEINKRDSKLMKILKKFSHIIAKLYVDIVRGTPMMVQAMVFFYGLAYGGINLDPLFAGLLIISFNTAAYIAEIIRSGINAIDSGQMEAAVSLGLSHKMAMTKIILPQALKNTIPALMNELIVNVKDTSVLSVIGVTELFYMTKGAASQNYLYFQSYVLTAIIYLILTKSLTVLFTWIIKKYVDKEDKMEISVPQSQTAPEVILCKK